MYSRRNNRDPGFSLITRERVRDNCLGILSGAIEHVKSSVSASSAGDFFANTNIHLTVSGHQIHGSSEASPQQDSWQSAETTQQTQQNPTLNQTFPQPSNRGRLLPIVLGLVGSGFAARAAGFQFPQRQRYQRANPSLPYGIISSQVDVPLAEDSGGHNGITSLLILICTTIFADRIKRNRGPNPR